MYIFDKGTNRFCYNVTEFNCILKTSKADDGWDIGNLVLKRLQSIQITFIHVVDESDFSRFTVLGELSDDTQDHLLQKSFTGQSHPFIGHLLVIG